MSSKQRLTPEQLERELALREQQLKSFFTSAPAGLAIIDAQLRYREINETLARTHGGSVEDNLGKSVSELLPELAPRRACRDGPVR